MKAYCAPSALATVDKLIDTTAKYTRTPISNLDTEKRRRSVSIDRSSTVAMISSRISSGGESIKVAFLTEKNGRDAINAEKRAVATPAKVDRGTSLLANEEELDERRFEDWVNIRNLEA